MTTAEVVKKDIRIHRTTTVTQVRDKKLVKQVPVFYIKRRRININTQMGL